MSFWKKMLGNQENPSSVTESESLDHELHPETPSVTEDIEASSQDESESLGTDPQELEAFDQVEVDASHEARANSPQEADSIGVAAELPEAAAPEVEEVEKVENNEESEPQTPVAVESPEQKIAREEAEAAEKLRKELEEAEEAALNAQLEQEQSEYEEDLSVLDGRILPQLKVPDWREELEFVKERYEPCDLSDHIVKVSKRRLTARQIDFELSQSRLNAYERYLDRASRRFKDRIEEDAHLNKVLADLAEWKNQQGKSVAWKLADRINQEVVKAKQAELDATNFVEKNTEFTNPAAIKIYRDFVRRAIAIPVTTLYLTSVVALTYNHFEWIMKFFPFFNLGLSKALIMITGLSSCFWLSNLWKYAKSVAKIQKQLRVFTARHQEQHDRIKHAVKQHTRLAQQQPMVEPILGVLAKAYRVQLQSNVSAKAHVTTAFDPAKLPACVTLARAIDTDEEKIARLKLRALNVLMSPGWRTFGLDEIARIHADSRVLDSSSLSLKSLDTDSVVSATNAQRLLSEAFTNTSIHERVSRARLVRAIKDLHKEVLSNWDSFERPKVTSLRDDGFDKISFQSSWLVDEDVSEDWIGFLREILGDETAPFGHFNILDKRSELNNAELIKSVAVVPHYFEIEDSKVKIEKSTSDEVMPLDVVVRVDVSPWANPSAFSVFAEDPSKASSPEADENYVNRGVTSV